LFPNALVDPYGIDGIDGTGIDAIATCQGQRLWRQNTVPAPPQGQIDNFDFHLIETYREQQITTNNNK
jgi:hypothetical protein